MGWIQRTHQGKEIGGLFNEVVPWVGTETTWLHEGQEWPVRVVPGSEEIVRVRVGLMVVDEDGEERDIVCYSLDEWREIVAEVDRMNAERDAI